jgi:hypothetical protein
MGVECQVKWEGSRVRTILGKWWIVVDKWKIGYRNAARKQERLLSEVGLPESVLY